MKKHLFTVAILSVTLCLSASTKSHTNTEITITMPNSNISPAPSAALPDPLMASAASTANDHSAQDLLPMLYVDNQLYRLSSEQPEPMGYSGSVSGHIVSSTEPSEVPAKHAQSNFGNVDEPYCLDAQSGQLITMVNNEWLRFVPINLTPQPVDLSRMTVASDILGASGIEVNYADNETIIFHSFAGLFRCKKINHHWSVTQTLDLASLEASATQGDYYTFISAQKDIVLISPKCYAPDNPLPITLQYTFPENKLELKGPFQDIPDPSLQWSYSEQAMNISQKLCQKPGLEKAWISNLYPASGSNSGTYYFIAAGIDSFSLHHGQYQEDTDHLTLTTILLPN